MGRSYKIFIVSLVFFLPFWLLANILNSNLESFWFVKEISANQSFLKADISGSLENLKEIRTEKILINNLNNLEIEAKSAMVAEIDNNWNSKIILEKNSKEILPIASLSKLMTALVIFELDETYNFSDSLLISNDAVNQEGFSKYGNLIVGEKITVENLLNKMLIESNNDSAYALAEYIGEKPFVDLMNLYAKKIRLGQTLFVNSTGLDFDFNDKTNLSSAENLFNLTKYILQNYPEIFEITKKQSYAFLKPDGSVHHFIAQNTNELLYMYPEIIGGKTGWTPLAEGCLLEIVKKSDGSGYFINIILGASDRFTEMIKIINAEINSLK